MRPVIGARRAAVLPHGAREAAVEVVAVGEPLVAAVVAAVVVEAVAVVAAAEI